MIRVLRYVLVASALLVPGVALAQTPSMGPPPGGTIGEEEPKQEGNAEKAPKETSPLPTLPALPPYPGQDRKKFELVTINGYLRVRTEWFDNFNLGFHDSGQGIPFNQPLTCRDTAPNTTTNNVMANACGGSIGSANMRVRLEPTFNLSENVAVHMQVDALDNLVLGSTPEGVFLNGAGSPAYAPGSFFSTSQTSPQAGVNSPWDSIRVKRAWGEVTTPVGQLVFGRMPNQWGMGMLYNAGGYDWVHGTTCTDCDYGDNVDRVMFGTTIPGTSLRAAAAMDWASSYPTSAQIDVWKTRDWGQPYDADDSDDITEYAFMLTHIDDPHDWDLGVQEGRTLFNYGAYFTYRSQEYEDKGVTLGSATPETGYIPRHAKAYIPDVWARFTTHKLIVEGELAGIFGNIDNLADTTLTGMAAQQTLRQIGGVARVNYLMFNDDLNLGLEVGFATGDQWENKNSGSVNVNVANYYPQNASDTTITNFRFNFDYHVDMILFREIMGAVTNATYVKPTLSYNITERFGFKIAGIMSFANIPVATPGNSSMYGIELNGDIGYSNKEEGFFAGISYGVLFPFAALDQPVTLFPNATNTSAGTAQTLQTRLVIKY
jgi:uncharacterized protein (TIGR04551 family)